MRTFALILSAFALPCFANDLPNQARPYDFEVTPSCMWNANSGRCVVQNRLGDQISCKVSITGKTFRGIVVGNTRMIIIPARQINDSARVYVPDGDVLTYISATAECSAQ